MTFKLLSQSDILDIFNVLSFNGTFTDTYLNEHDIQLFIQPTNSKIENNKKVYLFNLLINGISVFMFEVSKENNKVIVCFINNYKNNIDFSNKGYYEIYAPNDYLLNIRFISLHKIMQNLLDNTIEYFKKQYDELNEQYRKIKEFEGGKDIHIPNNDLFYLFNKYLFSVLLGRINYGIIGFNWNNNTVDINNINYQLTINNLDLEEYLFSEESPYEHRINKN